MWTAIQVALVIGGVVLAWAGDAVASPFLFYGGFACLGLAIMALGWEAVVTRRVVLGLASRGTGDTYVGLPALLQGVQFNVIGLFVLGLTALVASGTADEALGRLAARPGVPLAVGGLVCLTQAGIQLAGSEELKRGGAGHVLLNLIASRLLPGLILLAVGSVLMALGLFDLIAPAAFDAAGGGLLERLVPTSP